MANVVEAILRSRYIDGVSKGVEQTKGLLERDMQSMQNASNLFSSGFGGAMALVQQHLGNYQSRLTDAARTSTNQFAAMGLGAAAMALGIGGALVFAIQRSAQWAFQLVKEASGVAELRLSYESLTATRGRDADMLERLKAATEGQIGSSALLKNANKVLQSDLAITSEQYAELVQNVFSLAESAGTDQKQAIDTLTDSLIKGTARGLQPMIGVQLSVRDAVNETARAMGMQTSKFDEDAKRQVFYQELLKGTRAAVAALPVSFMSLDDAIERTSVQWQGMFSRIGEGIAKSRVAQELLVRLSQAMEGVGGNTSDIDKIALATNRFFIGLLQNVAAVLQVLGVFSTALQATWNLIMLGVKGVTAVLLGIPMVLSALGGAILQILGELPGAVGKALKGAGDAMVAWANTTGRSINAVFMQQWRDLGASDDVRKKLFGMADGARQLATEMAKMSLETIHGAAGVKRVGDQAAGAAVDQAKLNEQTKAFLDLLVAIAGRDLSPQEAALQKLTDDMRKIDELKMADVPDAEEKRVQLRVAALDAYSRALAKISDDEEQRATDVNEKQMELLRRLGEERRKQSAKEFEPEDDTFQRMAREQREQAIRSEEDLQRRLREMRERVGRDNPQAEWLKPLAELHDQMDRLNTVSMDPWHQTVAAMRLSLVDFTQQGSQAWASFWADLVSGQDNAGKKLLAAFIGMIGQMLVRIGVMLMQTGLAEIILAQTLVGRLMGASTTAGLKALAVGAVLAAAGGALQGAASNVAGTSQGSSSSGNSFQNVPRPVSNATQVVQIGRPGGFVGSDQASGGRLEVVIRMPPGMVATEQARNARANNQQVRLVTENAVY